jgi:hypothetical protein
MIAQLQPTDKIAFYSSSPMLTDFLSSAILNYALGTPEAKWSFQVYGDCLVEG